MSYVDLHCHILPGLDDGARTLADTVRYARRLDHEDVLDVACTPHIRRDAYPDMDVTELVERREIAQFALEADGLRVRLHQGGELAHEDALERDEDELKLIAQGPDDAPWVLLECPFEGFDDAFDEAVVRLGALGYGLLLAHPERAAGSLERLAPHVENGALLQVNVSSLAGEHGPRARGRAEKLVRDGLAFCLASDTHPGQRETTLPRGMALLQALGVSEIQAARLTQSNPRFLLREGTGTLAPPTTAQRTNFTR
jgi:protein-tyrosine phosphatase